MHAGQRICADSYTFVIHSTRQLRYVLAQRSACADFPKPGNMFIWVLRSHDYSDVAIQLFSNLEGSPCNVTQPKTYSNQGKWPQSVFYLDFYLYKSTE
jgi:hypothetical protein